ncbi:MAG: hypothetical protein ACE5JD_09805 [Candidatus Methylomirabilia bacterium]
MREYRYTVDAEGRIYHDGTEILDSAVLRFFLQSMKRTEDGQYLVLCQGERNWFNPYDTPYVVQRLSCVVEGGQLASVELCFAGDYRQPLDPSTLGAEAGRLFCRLRGGGVLARFGRVALQQLAPYLAEGPGGPALLLGGRQHPIGDLTPVTS